MNTQKKVVKMRRPVYDPALREPPPKTFDEASERIRYLSGVNSMLENSVTALREKVEGFDRMKQDVDTIAVYMRENMRDEIDRGDHNGVPMGALVVRYLQALKDVKHSRDMWQMATREVVEALGDVPRWVRLLFGVQDTYRSHAFKRVVEKGEN